ncbi:MAG: hypothetical protein ACTHMR_06845, partial [Thermomicrobiales bacterium]
MNRGGAPASECGAGRHGTTATPARPGSEAQESNGRAATMVTIGEQLQLSRRLGTALTSHRASLLGS